jgi:hypothetical protein
MEHGDTSNAITIVVIIEGEQSIGATATNITTTIIITIITDSSGMFCNRSLSYYFSLLLLGII